MEADIVPRDTSEHHVLHSLIRHAQRDGVDYRPVSEIATGMHEDYSRVSMALDTLIDWGVVVRATGKRGEGFEVLEPCPCAPPRKTKGSFTRPGDAEAVAVRKKISEPQIGLKPLRRNGFSPDTRTSYDHNDLTRPWHLREGPETRPQKAAPEGCRRREPVSTPLAPVEWRSLPGNIVGGRIRRKVGRPPGHDTSMGLACCFQARCEALDLKLQSVNLSALAKSFSAWKRDGVSAERIRLMIAAFHPAATLGVPAWRLFLSQRQALFELTRFRHEGRRQDAEHWSMQWSTSRDDSDERWLGISKKPRDDSDEHWLSVASKPRDDSDEYWFGTK